MVFSDEGFDNKRFLTIFTPTYNRANLLARLYDSLVKQTNKDFTWLIIDDGSQDNTTEIVNEWITEKKIHIQYHFQQNRGKHFAFNKAIHLSESELFIDIDSDDFLLDHSVDRFISLWKNIPDKELFSGIMGLCQTQCGSIIGQKYPLDEFISNAFHLRYSHKIWGDKAMLYHTKVLKNYQLPEIHKQIVMESILHNRISQGYKSLCVNEPLIVKEYLKDGLTNAGLDKTLDARIILYNEMNFFDLSVKTYVYINSRYVKYSLINKLDYLSILENAINRKNLFHFAYIIGYLKYKRFLFKKKKK